MPEMCVCRNFWGDMKPTEKMKKAVIIRGNGGYFFVLFFAGFVCFAACLGELIAAGRILEAAADAADALLDLIDRHALDQSGDGF